MKTYPLLTHHPLTRTLAVVAALLTVSATARAQGHGVDTGPTDEQIVQQSHDRQAKIDADKDRARAAREAKYQRDLEAERARNRQLAAEAQRRQLQADADWRAKQQQIELAKKRQQLFGPDNR